jgi:membrane-associated phospholipid phosphatase
LPITRTRAASSAVLAVLAILLIAIIPVWVFNQPLFSLLNGWHSPLTDPIWLALTTLGDGLILAIIVGAFLLVNPRVTVMGLVLMLFASVLVNTVKLLFPTLRPISLMDSVHVLGPLLRSGSFPSGHTASSIAAALSIAYFTKSRVAGSCVIVIGVLISLSRIFVGAHFPRDVIGGTICAVALFGVFTSFVWPSLEPHIPDRPDFSRLSFRVLFCAEVAATAYTLVIHAPYYAEWSAAAWAASGAVAVFLGVRGWAKIHS